MEELLLVVVAETSSASSWWYADIDASSSRMGTRRSLKRFNMKGYSAKLAAVLYQSISHLKKALFCLCQGLQSLYCNRDEIHNLLILYITNSLAWVSVYSSYLPTPVRVVWLILSSYYRRAFVDDASRKNQAASLWSGRRWNESHHGMLTSLPIHPTL